MSILDLRPLREAYAAADAGRLCVELVRSFPDDPEIGRLHELVCFAMLGGDMPADLSPASRMFLEHLAHLAGRTVPGAAPRGGRRQQLSSELDFIADLGGAAGWSIAQALNRLAMDRIEPKRRAAVVGTMRDDGIYIMEFVAHYRALGFEHLFIYTNDNADSSLELLDLLARHGVITVLESEVTGQVPPEAKAFGYALHLLEELRDYEWALFVDSDELLVPAPRYEHSIVKVLDALRREDPQGHVAGICYDWLWFISDMVFERQPGLLSERFQHAKPHWLGKCLVRVRDVMSMRHQHYPEVATDCLVVDSMFQPLDLSSIWQRRRAQYGGGRINHYWPRSFQEFAIKKARGASLKINASDNLYDRPYEQFFTWNGYCAADNHHPTDPLALQKVRDEIDALRALEGVAAVADRIEQEWPQFLARVAKQQDLHVEYTRNSTEPGEIL
jgi:hypothetical protein